MENSTLTILLVNAAVTIITTAVVTRITLNKGRLFNPGSIKTITSTAFQKYKSVLMDALMLFVNFFYVVRFLFNGDPIRKFEVMTIPFNFLGLLFFSIFLFVDLKRSRKQDDA